MTKRMPEDYTLDEMFALVLHHHAEHQKAKTALMQTRDKLIVAQKELSALKRQK